MNVTTLPRNTKLPFPIHPGQSALERHGIDHLSASSLNAWIAAPALWIMERLIGRKGAANCAMHRGTAVETGVSVGLFGGTRAADCAATALALYDELTAASGDPKRDAERAVIPGMVAQALAAISFGAPSVPEGKQHRIVVRLEGVPVPLIGYLDWFFPERGVIVDLKTTLRVPSSFSDAHRRQAALYQHAHANAGVAFVYCSDKRSATLNLDRGDYEEGVRELTHAARRLERFLALSDDPHELADLITPDFGTFYWNDPDTRALGRQTFGF